MLSKLELPKPSALQVQKVIIVIIPSFSPANNNLLLLLIIRHGIQQLLELRLRHLLSQLTRLRQRNQTVLDFVRARLLDQTDATQTVRRFGMQDLVQYMLSGVVLLSIRARGQFASTTQNKLLADNHIKRTVSFVLGHRSLGHRLDGRLRRCLLLAP